MRDIVIVGGGFAGWYTAVALRTHHADINITLIDSDKFPRLGVGETLGWSSPYDFKKLLGLKDDRILMRQTGAIYKYGVTATDFYNDNTSYSYGKFFNLKIKSLAKFYGNFDYPEFYEPWSRQPGDVGLQQAWLSINKNNNKNFNDYILELNEASYFVKSASAPYDSYNNYILRPTDGYSYHVDAEQTVSFLKNNAVNINHISSPVVDIIKNSQGIDHLLLENKDKITGDLFIDASGFSRILAKEVNDTWTNMSSDYCNSAWVCPSKYIAPKIEMTGGTEFYGEDYGWRFKIKLYHRIGNGYIFNNNMIDKDIPLQRLLKLTGNTRLKDPKLISWTPGYYRTPWVKNVLALGVAHHMIDPFDGPSFDIHSRSLEDLLKVFLLDDAAQEFNKSMTKVTHERNLRLLFTFGISKRQGEFWDTRRKMMQSKESEFKKILNEETPELESRLTHFWQQMYYRMCMAGEMDRKQFNAVELTDADKAMAESFFAYNRARNKYIATQAWPNYYEWLKANRFNGMTSEEILDELR